MEFLTVTDLFCKCESPRKILCLCSMSQVLPQDPEREDAPQDSEQRLELVRGWDTAGTVVVWTVMAGLGA